MGCNGLVTAAAGSERIKLDRRGSIPSILSESIRGRCARCSRDRAIAAVNREENGGGLETRSTLVAALFYKYGNTENELERYKIRKIT